MPTEVVAASVVLYKFAFFLGSKVSPTMLYKDGMQKELQALDFCEKLIQGGKIKESLSLATIEELKTKLLNLQDRKNKIKNTDWGTVLKSPIRSVRAARQFRESATAMLNNAMTVSSMARAQDFIAQLDQAEAALTTGADLVQVDLTTRDAQGNVQDLSLRLQLALEELDRVIEELKVSSPNTVVPASSAVLAPAAPSPTPDDACNLELATTPAALATPELNLSFKCQYSPDNSLEMNVRGTGQATMDTFKRCIGVIDTFMAQNPAAQTQVTQSPAAQTQITQTQDDSKYDMNFRVLEDLPEDDDTIALAPMALPGVVVQA